MSYGPEFYAPIQLAIETSGAQGVADLDAKLASVTAQVNAYRAQLAAGTITAGDFIASTTELIGQQTRLTEAVAAANRVLGGMPASLDSVQSSSKGATRAVLEFSRGLEDLSTGGFLGVLNNIPGMFGGIARQAGLAAPQVAGVEAAAGILGTTAYLVYTNWGKVKELFDQGVGVKIIPDVKELQKELKALTEKEWKTLVDVQSIEDAKGKIDELTRAKAGFDKLNAPDEATKKRGTAVTDAIVEGSASGGGRAGFTQAVLDLTSGPLSGATKDFAKATEELEKKIEAAMGAGDHDRAARLQQQQDDLGTSREGKRAQEEINRREKIERRIGSAASGDEKDRAWLADLVGKNRDNFAARGFDDQRIEGGLASAAPDQLFAEERRKLKEARDKEDEARQKAVGDEAKGRTRDAVAQHGPGFDDKLQADFFGVAKAGGDVDAARTAARPAIVAGLRGRGVGEDVVGDVATTIIDKAAVVAQNHVLEGTMPKIPARAAVAEKKAGDDRDDAVGAQVRRVAPGLDDALKAAALRRVERGQTPQQAADALRPQVEARLPGRDVPPGLVADVAKGLMARVKDEVSNAIDKERGADPGLNARQAAGNLGADIGNRIERRDRGRDRQNQTQVFGAEFQRRTGANDGEAEQAGAAIAGLVAKGAPVEQAMGQTYTSMMQHARQVQEGMLRQQALAESMMGVMGPSTEALARLSQRQAMLQGQVSAMRGRLRGFAQPQGSGLGAGDAF